MFLSFVRRKFSEGSIQTFAVISQAFAARIGDTVKNSLFIFFDFFEEVLKSLLDHFSEVKLISSIRSCPRSCYHVFIPVLY